MSYGSEAVSSQPGPWAGTNPRFGGRASQQLTPKLDEDRPAARSQAWATRGHSRGLRLTLARRCKHARNAVGDCSGAGAVYHHACNRICRQISREPCHSSRARGRQKRRTLDFHEYKTQLRTQVKRDDLAQALVCGHFKLICMLCSLASACPKTLTCGSAAWLHRLSLLSALLCSAMSLWPRYRVQTMWALLLCV